MTAVDPCPDAAEFVEILLENALAGNRALYRSSLYVLASVAFAAWQAEYRGTTSFLKDDVDVAPAEAAPQASPPVQDHRRLKIDNDEMVIAITGKPTALALIAVSSLSAEYAAKEYSSLGGDVGDKRKAFLAGWRSALDHLVKIELARRQEPKG